MLTISRRVGESFVIDDDIEVIVQQINRSSVRISIKAPEDVAILRKELYERIDNEMDKPN